jgi:hypothetical protein
MWRRAILMSLLIAAAQPLFAHDGEVTVDSRFAAFGFDDGRQSDFDWVAPLFTKYGVHATFNIINTDGHSKPDYAAKVNKLIAEGHEIGDHTVLHNTYMYEQPFCDGQNTPSNDDMRKEQGNGRNIFNTPLDQKVKDSITQSFARIGISDPDNKTWRTLTDEDCQKIRNYYSAWNGGALKYLDEQSAIYCGTTGSSKAPDSWNGKEFTKGIFTGCKTTCNHEIWERLVAIQRQWYAKYYNLKTPPTNWSQPGGQRCPCLLYCKEGKRYFDRECTILANHYGKCRSTRTGKNRSWADLLRENDFKTVSESIYEGLYDGSVRRSILIEMPFNANLCKDDNVCRDASFDRVWYAPVKEYDPKQEPLASSTDWLKTIYEVDANFKRETDKIVQNCASGRIVLGLNDSVDAFSHRLVYDLCLQFCKKANIKAISMKEAYEIAYKTPLTKGNLFRNPKMERTVFKIIGAKNSPEAPDGWTAGRVEGTALVLEGTNKSEYFVFGVPLGNLDFSFSAIKGTGSSRLTIKKARNIDPYLKSEDCPVLKEIVIDNEKTWKEYRASLLLEDAPRLESPSALSPTCDGWDNKICGLVFVLEGKETRFAAPSLTSRSD